MEVNAEGREEGREVCKYSSLLSSISHLVLPLPSSLFPSILLLLGITFTCPGWAQSSPPSGSSGAAQEGYIIPFEYDPPVIPFPVIKVRINGSEPMSFMIDTGSNVPLLLDGWAAQQLDLHPSDAPVPLQRSSVVLHEVSIAKMQLLMGGAPYLTRYLEVPLKTAYTGDLSSLFAAFGPKRVAGAIGVNLLTSLTARFDFAAKTLTLFTQPNAPLHIPGATTVPMRKDGNAAKYLVNVVLPEGPSTELLVDTGSSPTLVPADFQQHLHPLGMKASEHKTTGGVSVTYRYLLPAVQIGSLIVPRVVVDGALQNETPVLGLNVLSRFCVTLDFPNQEMTLQPLPGRAEDPRIDGISGAVVALRSGRWVVQRVAQGLPAAQAGLRPGDTLLAIDGRDLASIPWINAQALLDGAAGMPARITLKRGQAPTRQVSFVRAMGMLPPKPIAFGFNAERAPGSTGLIVTEVTPGLLADKAGLRIGDEIIQLNGVQVTQMSPQQIEAAGRLQMMRLQVRRAGEEHLLDLTLLAQAAVPSQR